MAISVTEPVGPAINWTRQMLFRPFSMEKWFAVGFCAWLAYLGQGGGGTFPSGHFRGGGSGGPDFQPIISWVKENLALVITIGAALLLLFLVIGLLVCWLSSRGRFMFLDNVVRNRAEIREPWDAFRDQGNSLFLFRMSVGLGAFLAVAAIAGVVLLLALPSIRARELLPAGVAAIVAGGLLILALSVFCGLLTMFTEDFVVPVMYLRGGRVLAAWGEVWPLIRANAGVFVLYVLFKLVIGMVVGMIAMLVFCATCCCLAVLPFLWAVALLPLLVFMRSYSVIFLAQFGSGYRLLPEISLDAGAHS
jgi:hypothetical protein